MPDPGHQEQEIGGQQDGPAGQVHDVPAQDLDAALPEYCRLCSPEDCCGGALLIPQAPREEFTPPLRPHDPRCPECHGRDRYDDWCRTCGAEAIDVPRNQECMWCTVDGCGGHALCKHDNPVEESEWD